MAQIVKSISKYNIYLDPAKYKYAKIYIISWPRIGQNLIILANRYNKLAYFWANNLGIWANNIYNWENICPKTQISLAQKTKVGLGNIYIITIIGQKYR